MLITVVIIAITLVSGGNWQESMKNSRKADQLTSTEWDIIAEIADCSNRNVRNVIKRDKPDNYNIKKIVGEYLEMRENFIEEVKEILIRKYRKVKI